MGRNLTVGIPHSDKDVIISGIHIDLQHTNMVEVSMQCGLKTKRGVYTLEAAQEIGLLNIEALRRDANIAFNKKFAPNKISSSMRDLRKRDMFWCDFGYSHQKFIVKDVGPKGVVVTSPSWMKSSVTYFSWDELQKRDCMIAGRYSKLRWWLKF